MKKIVFLDEYANWRILSPAISYDFNLENTCKHMKKLYVYICDNKCHTNGIDALNHKLSGFASLFQVEQICHR